MSSPHRPLDHRSGLVLDTHELGRRAGAMRTIARTVQAPPDLRVGLIEVPPESPIEVDLRLESVVEGVLVTGTATVQVQGECARCLTPIAARRRVDVQELFVYPGSEAGEDEVSRLVGDKIDLEPLLRDDVVVDLPFQPRCREDCRGLRVECGADLNADPQHHHDELVDSRWAQLAGFDARSGEYDGGRKPEAS